MHGFEILIPLAPFIMVVAIIAIPAWLKSRDRREMQQTLRSAIEKGQPLPPEVIDALGKEGARPPSTAGRDMRVGVIWLAVALGVAMFGWMLSYVDGDSEIFYVMGGMAAIPGFIGLAFIILSFFNKNND